MDKAKLQELRGLDKAALEKELMASKEELFKLRMQKGTGQLTNFARMKILRRHVARIETFLRQEQKEVKGN